MQMISEDFIKGDRAIYMGTQHCTIIEKHSDDIPNQYYYTIKMDDSGLERQTTSERLSRAPVASPCSDTIKLSESGREMELTEKLAQSVTANANAYSDVIQISDNYLCCKQCRVKLANLCNLFFYSRHEDLLLTTKFTFKASIDSKIVRLEGGSANRGCKFSCINCNASLGHELPFGPKGEKLLAFGPEKIVLEGRVFSKADKWRILCQDGSFAMIENRNRSNFYEKKKQSERSKPRPLDRYGSGGGGKRGEGAESVTDLPKRCDRVRRFSKQTLLGTFSTVTSTCTPPAEIKALYGDFAYLRRPSTQNCCVKLAMNPPPGHMKPNSLDKPREDEGKVGGARGEVRTQLDQRGFALKRVFEKFLRPDSHLTPMSFKDATNFLAFMAVYDPKSDLLFQLADEKKLGKERIRDILEMCNGNDKLVALYVPLLKFLFDPSLAAGLNVRMRDRVVTEIFHIPCFDLLVDQVHEVTGDALELSCQFLKVCALGLLEARASSAVHHLAGHLRDLHVPGAESLCSILMIDTPRTHDVGRGEDVLGGKEAGRGRIGADIRALERSVCWVTDRIPPGGRHDNDKLNFRDISIVPTSAEVACSTPPYLPLASEENRVIAATDDLGHLLDSQFRLLREDFMRPLREAVESDRCLLGARPVDLFVRSNRKFGKPCVVFKFDKPKRLEGKSTKECVEFWESFRGLEVDSLVCFRKDRVPVRYGTVAMSDKDASWLGHPDGPFVGVDFEREEDLSATLAEFGGIAGALGGGGGYGYELLAASQSFFTYKPILACLQQLDSLPLTDELVSGVDPGLRPVYLPSRLTLPRDFGSVTMDLDAWRPDVLKAETTLDDSQVESLRLAFSTRVSLIQGPPGTGKTFMGALIARTILANTTAKILCVCYTNHALDQFLEDLLDKGIDSIVRIGGRCKSPALEPFKVSNLARIKAGNTALEVRRAVWQVSESLERKCSKIDFLQNVLEKPVEWDDVKAFLEVEDPEIAEQLTFDPTDSSGFSTVGKDGKAVKADYVWEQWLQGRSSSGLPQLDHRQPLPRAEIWSLPEDQRKEMVAAWKHIMNEPLREELSKVFRRCVEMKQQLASLRQEGQRVILRSARIIGATTSGAAKHKELIDGCGAEVVIVEEAGEILEAHVLASLSASVKHLILIGDHKQLRPKLECHDLTVVAGKGYNLDRSLFERLVLESNLPSSLLAVQHRMRPEVSQLIRMSTYPELRDHDSVRSHPPLRGLAKNVIFVDHRVLENGCDERSDSKDFLKADKTKMNDHEALLCVETVRLLLLQGYKQSQVVVLTPYLGQLRLVQRHIRSKLSDVNALVADLDRAELRKEGLIGDDEAKGASDDPDDVDDDNSIEAYDDEQPTQERDGTGAGGAGRGGAGAAGGGRGRAGVRKAGGPTVVAAASTSKNSDGVRIATVDNYQGEESDVVIISLVRSNRRGDVGFLKEPQRVNVLLSRARFGMIIFGNSDTLCCSAKGKDVWKPILDHLRASESVLEGLHSFCQLHPQDVCILKMPEDFRRARPNGGCTQQCTSRLPCGHSCPQRCHFVDRNHEFVRCVEACTRFPPGCPNEHPCPKRCWQKCGQCEHKMTAELACGHVEQTICHVVSSPERIAQLRCSMKVPVHLTKCGHDVTLQCSSASSPNPFCNHKCTAELPCGHRCQSKHCGGCALKKKHDDCKIKCERAFFCGHRCEKPCHGEAKCSPCTQPCAVNCFHSKCPKACADTCSSCAEPCVWSCAHRGRCTLPCGAPCNRLPCDLRCSLLLSCGHQCPSVCGEACPPAEYCHTCGKKGEVIVDYTELKKYSACDVETDPVIVLPCGHFFSMSTLDGHMELDRVYSRTTAAAAAGACAPFTEVNTADCTTVTPSVSQIEQLRRARLSFLGVYDTDTAASGDTSNIAVAAEAGCMMPNWSHPVSGADISAATPKACPDCRAVIHSVLRYGRLLRYSELKVLERKHAIQIDSRIARLSTPPNVANGESEQQAWINRFCQLGSLLTLVRKGPTQKVYEAAGGGGQVEVPKPSALKLIRVLLLLVEHFQGKVESAASDEAREKEFQRARKYADEALEVAENSSVVRTGADVRICNARLLRTAYTSHGLMSEPHKAEVQALLDWVINHPSAAVTPEQKETASRLRQAVSMGITPEEKASVVIALGGSGGFAGHWYECPNGHEYFIDNCGMANQVSRCIECGARVGGESYQLTLGNARAERLISSVSSAVAGGGGARQDP